MCSSLICIKMYLIKNYKSDILNEFDINYQQDISPQRDEDRKSNLRYAHREIFRLVSVLEIFVQFS